jgi:hypothetical protein
MVLPGFTKQAQAGSALNLAGGLSDINSAKYGPVY